LLLVHKNQQYDDVRRWLTHRSYLLHRALTDDIRKSFLRLAELDIHECAGKAKDDPPIASLQFE
jgi:hypothetical protein